MATVYRYTLPHYDYSGEVENYGYTAVNTTTIKPELYPGYWPRWNGNAWEQVEDHRKRDAEDIKQDATEYWLPGDTWQTPARIMVDVGPLPAGALMAKPEPTEAELCTMRIEEIMGELQAIDTAKVRPLAAIIDGSATAEEQVRLAELNARADALRAEMQMLEAFI